MTEFRNLRKLRAITSNAEERKALDAYAGARFWQMLAGEMEPEAIDAEMDRILAKSAETGVSLVDLFRSPPE